MYKSEGIQTVPVKTSFFYGWVIVAVAALGLFFSGPGQTYSISVFVDAYIRDFEWSRSLVSSFYSMATLTAGMILPVLGRRMDRFGYRKFTVVIAVLLAVTCLWMSFVYTPVMLFMGFLFLRLFGQGSMVLISSVVVPQWFIKKRGIAMSIMAVGGVAGSATLPPVNNYLIQHIGLSYTWIIWAGLLTGVMVPIGWTFIRNRPEDIGLLPDGSHHNVDNVQEENRNHIVDERSWTLQEARKTRAFWLMLFCVAIPALVNTGLTFHMMSIIKLKGFSSGFAASILSITAMIQLPLTFMAGYVLDRVKVHHVKAVNFWILVVAMVVILKGSSEKILILYGVLHGIFVAFDSVSTGVLWSNYYGRHHLGSIRGIAMTSMVVGSSLGPLPFGFAYDMFQGYGEIILIMMILPILGSTASILSPLPQWKE